MKKLFFLAAALVAAVSMNAQQTTPATYYFDNSASTYTLTGSESGNAFTATTYSMDGVEGVAYNFTVNGEQKGYLYLAESDKIFFEYKNSSNKTPAVKSGLTYLVCDSKNFVLNVKSLKADDVVYLLYSGKSSDTGKGASLTNADNENTQVVTGEEYSATNDAKADAAGKQDGENVLSLFAVKAVANGGIKIKEINNGMRVFAIGINQKPVFPAPTAVENTVEAVKVTKVIENGQLVIIKNGVRFNAAGAKL